MSKRINTRIAKICEQCGVKFSVTHSAHEKGIGKFCSLKCYGQSKILSVEGTHAENMADAKQKGRFPRGSNRPEAKLTEQDVREIRLRYRRGLAESLGKEYGVARRTISNVVSRRSWDHVIP